MLQFGLVGMGWLMVLLLVFFRDFARLIRRSPMPLIAFWYVGVGIAMFLGSFTEGLITFGIPVPEIVGAIAFAGLRNMYDERAVPSLATIDSFRRFLPQGTQEVVQS
jgi:hypothetical protein